MNQNWLPFIQIQGLPPSMHDKGKKLLILYAKKSMEIIGDQLPMKNYH